MDLGLGQVLRRVADEAREIGAVAREIALRLLAAGAGGGEPCLGLRHVGAGQRADAELVLRRFELAPEDLLVVDVEIDRRLIAQDVEIGLDDAEEDRAFGRGVARALGLDRLLGGGGARHRLAALVDRLGDVHVGRLGLERRVRGRGGRCGRRILDALGAGRAGELHGRAPAGKRLRHAFVGGADIGALGRDLRIGVVGRDQRLLERFRARDHGAREKRRHGRRCKKERTRHRNP